MGYIADELAYLRRENVRLNQRLARTDMSGTVVKRDEKRWRVQLAIGEDPETGEQILSPMVRVKAISTGDLKISAALPPIGAPMVLRSRSGVIGEESSFAEPEAFNDAHRRPEQSADETVIEKGGARISIKADGIEITYGGKGFKLVADEMKMTTRLRAKGGSRPAHYVGGRDSRGDVALDGNDDFLI